MSIIQALNINTDDRHVISIVGAGGKTTLLYRLSKELRNLGKRVILTTTTHIYIPSKDNYDSMLISEEYEAVTEFVKNLYKSGIYVLGEYINGEDKLKGIDKILVNRIFDFSSIDYVLVEADGAKNKSIKAPDGWEPIIPDITSIVIGVIGMDSLEKVITEESIHRVENFCNICECKIGDIIDEEMICKLITHPFGLFKNAPKSAKKIVFLNKTDSTEIISKGLRIKNMLAQYRDISIILASMKKDKATIFNGCD